MSNRNSGLSIDASYQLESKTSANQKQESPVAAMFVNGSGQNEDYVAVKTALGGHESEASF
jgi:hypothetical protein